MSRRRKESIDLGLAVLSVITPPGVCRTHQEIAECCDCSWQNIFRIEHTAMRKIRRRLFMQHDTVLAELLQMIRPGFVNGEAAADAGETSAHGCPPARYRLAVAAFHERKEAA